MMVKMALCDDNLDALLPMVQYLKQMHQEGIQYEIYQEPMELLQRITDEKDRFDIYILDIEMPKIDGMALAVKIREMDKHAVIIFQTSHLETVFETFKVRAHRFLQKPVQYEPFVEAIESSFALIREWNQFFDFVYEHQPVQIACDEIIYIEKNLRKIIIHTVDGEYSSYMGMKETMEQLDDNVFVRTGVSYVVNIKYIKIVKKDSLITRQDIELPISKSYKKKIKDKQLHYEMAHV
ncbi:MAG: LytTR family DNA-binding domain-containing protein [Lachnospiraceae bacterium]|nr:LytTR family DNA-binding domain-containing protein [Lachnospiraceae bacterium]